MNKIAIYGAGGCGREVLMLIQQINATENCWDFVGFYDDSVASGTVVNNYKVLGGIDELNNCLNSIAIVIAVGNPVTKKKIFQSINNTNIFFPVLIHPGVLIGDRSIVTIGGGSIITASCILTVNIKIGDHVLLNIGCTVCHDSTIKSFCSLMPAVNVSGEVMIDECVYIGTGAKIIHQINIGSNSIIGAGAVVINDIPADCTAVGVPAKCKQTIK